MFKSKWQYVSTLVILTLVGLFFGSTPPAAYAATCTSIAIGNWSDTATWDCGVVPGANDDVVIATGHSVFVFANATAANVTINGTMGILMPVTLDVSGNWTNNGTFMAGPNTVNFNGTGAQTIGGTSTTIFNTMNISNGGRTVTFASNVGIAGAANWAGGSCAALLSLRSSAPGTARTITNAAFLTANFVDVQDSNADAVVTVANGKNSGNNTNWTITTTCPVPVAPKAVGGVAQTIAMPTASTNGLGYLAGLAGVVMLVGAGWLVSKR